VRYRSVLPLNLSNPTITYEIPFGAIERPEGEYPAQNWVDVNDGSRGAALLNRGIPGHSLIGNTLTTSLMKCIKVVDYHHGGYSPRTRDEGGFEIGIPHHFEQAIIPHTGDWRDAHLTRAGMDFNSPLVTRKVPPHGGALPGSGSFAAVEPANTILHALYAEGEQLVLRVAECKGQATTGKVTLRWQPRQVEETDFLGNMAQTLAPTESGFAFSAQPFEIKTFRVTL
jgi:alpha-mannosidase